MSHVSPKPDQQTSAETAALANLTALATSGPGEFIYKTGPTTFANGVPVGGGSGTVTSVSVVNANGFSGSVATATTTPAITITTTVTGLLKGNGTAISAAVAGTDYQLPITLTTTGTSGPATLISNVLNIPQYSGGGGTMAIGGTVTSGTVGSILFIGTGPVLAQNNTNYFWDNTNLRLGVRTASPQQAIHTAGFIAWGGATNYMLFSGTPTAVRTWTFSDVSDTVVGLVASQALTNKSVNGVTLTTGGGTTNFLNANGTYSVPVGTVYTGTTNRITVTGTVIDISAAYVGQSSITTLGTVTTGTWQGTPVANAYIASASTWNAKQDAISLTTTGTSGLATFVSNVLNIPNYTAGITGSGASNQVTFWTSGSAVGGSSDFTFNNSTKAFTTQGLSTSGFSTTQFQVLPVVGSVAFSSAYDDGAGITSTALVGLAGQELGTPQIVNSIMTANAGTGANTEFSYYISTVLPSPYTMFPGQYLVTKTDDGMGNVLKGEILLFPGGVGFFATTGFVFNAPTYNFNGVAYVMPTALATDPGAALVDPLADGTLAWALVGTPAGNTNSVQFNDSGVFNGATYVGIEHNVLRLERAATPTTPAAAGANVYDTDLANRDMPTWVDPDGIESKIQAFFGQKSMSMWQALPQTTTGFSVWGCQQPTVLSTTSASTSVAVSGGTFTQSRKRTDALKTVAASNAAAGFYSTDQLVIRGSVSGAGGYTFVMRWLHSTGTTLSTKRAFCGLHSSVSAPTDVDPSTLSQFAGMGWDSADTNIQFMTRSNTGTVVKINTGIIIPSVDKADMYELQMYTPPAGTTIYFRITNIVTGADYSGSTNTNIPTAVQSMGVRCWASVGGTSSVIGVGVYSMYLEAQ